MGLPYPAGRVSAKKGLSFQGTHVFLNPCFPRRPRMRGSTGESVNPKMTLQSRACQKEPRPADPKRMGKPALSQLLSLTPPSPGTVSPATRNTRRCFPKKSEGCPLGHPAQPIGRDPGLQQPRRPAPTWRALLCSPAPALHPPRAAGGQHGPQPAACRGSPARTGLAVKARDRRAARRRRRRRGPGDALSRPPHRTPTADRGARLGHRHPLSP